MRTKRETSIFTFLFKVFPRLVEILATEAKRQQRKQTMIDSRVLLSSQQPGIFSERVREFIGIDEL